MIVQTPTVYPTPKKTSFLNTYASEVPESKDSKDSKNSGESLDSKHSHHKKHKYAHKNRLFENVSTFLLFLIMFLLIILAVQKLT